MFENSEGNSSYRIVKLLYDFLIRQKNLYSTSSLTGQHYEWSIFYMNVNHRIQPLLSGIKWHLKRHVDNYRKIVKNLYKTDTSIRQALWLFPRVVRIKRLYCIYNLLRPIIGIWLHGLYEGCVVRKKWKLWGWNNESNSNLENCSNSFCDCQEKSFSLLLVAE